MGACELEGMENTDVVIMIPARFESVRFPGKPLTPLLGTSLIQRCYQSAAKVPGLSGVFVATDDERIADHVRSFGGKVIMTPRECRNGTERCSVAVDQLPVMPEIVVNWQGDSPLISSDYVSALISALRDSGSADLVTPAIRCDAELFERLKSDRAARQVGGTMVVVSRSRRALYFSKELLPFSDKVGCFEDSAAGPKSNLVEDFFFHIGMYAYRTSTLREYASWPLGPLEAIEGLEQLRFLENDRRIDLVVVEGKGHWEVNNPEDVPLVEALLKSHGLV